MLLSVRQINQSELVLLIQQTASGAALSGSLGAYFAASGWVGNTVLYTTGGAQSVTGTKTFLDSPIVPSGGLTITAANKDYVLAQVGSLSSSLSGYIDSFFVSRVNDQTILGRKVFTGAVGVGSPTQTGDATNLAYVSQVSGVLQTQITNITVSNTVNLTGNQLITGTKSFVSSPLVPVPTDGSGAVPKSYVDSLTLTGVVYTTGSQTISGVKTFLDSPVIPVAVASNQPVTLAQLQGTAFNYAPTTGYSVTSLNGVTGSVLTQGVNGITTYMCNNILYVSGNAQTSSLLYSAQIPLASGATGVSFVWGTGFLSKPTVTTNLEVTGSAPIFFVQSNLYGVTTGGFNVAFQSGIPHASYVLDFTAIPTTSGSGFFALRGEQGLAQPTWNPRGAWQLGVSYSRYDTVFVQDVFNSYVATSGNNSDSFNKPAGTGNAYWAIIASGGVGPVGPTGAVGSITLQSGAYITGSFTSLSYFLSPASSGLNLAESFVGYSFNITGYKLGCYSSGTNPLNGGILSGRLYVRDDINVKTTLKDFTFTTGVFTYFSGGLAIPFSGGYRLGVDITNTLSGLDGFSVGIFGF